MENRNFAQLLAAVRTGDQQAAAELVRRYEPQVRSIVRLRLHGSRLRRLFDSMDVCQSVLAVFFDRAAAGRFDLQTPEQLVGLFVKMARNKLATLALRNRKHQGGLPAGWDIADTHGAPSPQAAHHDLLQAVLDKLPEQERALFEQNKVHGRPWSEIAAKTGGNAAALRIRLARALAKAREELQQEDLSRGR